MVRASTLPVVVFTLSKALCDGCPAATILNSNRSTPQTACVGADGAECMYHCDSGYIPVGRHVCQTYQAGGQHFINGSFFGGRCERLCQKDVACTGGRVPVRNPSSDEHGVCLKTTCSLPDAALRHLARGNYEVWRRARYEPTGIYVDTVPLPGMPNATANMGRASMTGVGVMFECVADAMGWESRVDTQKRVIQSISALNGDVPITRTSQGWYPSFFNAQSGEPVGKLSGCMMCTGLMMAGVNFARNYYESVDPGSANTQRISSLVASLFRSVRWQDVLCNHQQVVDAANGTGLPMVEMSDGTCTALQFPRSDGYYEFNEEHYTFWFASLFGPHNQALQLMWERWQGRKEHPHHEYAGHDLLSMWAGYIVHLPFYTTQSFNSDSTYNSLLKSHWLADWAYYNGTTYAGERGRYGVGAGTTPQWCTGGSSYISDQIGGGSHCRIISPYITAGYMPVAPETIQTQLLELLADGETVYNVPNSEYSVLWRKSMLDPSWQGGYGITMVDFSSELFGLSTIWLGADFYRKHSGFKQVNLTVLV